MPASKASNSERRSGRSRLGRWWKGRRYVRLAAALPVLLALLALLALIVFRLGWQPASTEAKVRDTAARAMAARDFATASLAYQELLQLRSDGQPDYRFRLALSLRGQGRER